MGALPHKPSNDDLVTARFLFNEARIKEKLDEAHYQSVLLDQQKNSQATWLRKLTDTQDDASFPATMHRTHTAVVAQLAQLKNLDLPINDLDKKIMNILEDQLRIVQQTESNRGLRL